MSISRKVLAKYIKPGCTFIETGTKWGDTCIKAIELGASRVYSFEIDKEMAAIAKRHVADALREKSERVAIHHGCSTAQLSLVAWAIDSPCDVVVFLDAHTESYSPVLYELHLIEAMRAKPRVILIDDVRCWPMWNVTRTQVEVELTKIGRCDVTFEDGIVPEDILVARF